MPIRPRGPRITLILPIALAMLFTGCSDVPPPKTPDAQSGEADKQVMLDRVDRAEHDATNAKVPPPVIDLTAPVGWRQDAPQALPENEHGFTVAYFHKSGIAVTLFQFTNRLKAIPDDVNERLVKREMKVAKIGIDEAVRMGRWQAATEKKNETVKLGDSSQSALWSQYELISDDRPILSDIYVWTHANTFLKLRCTSHSGNSASDEVALKRLLTALGNASTISSSQNSTPN